MRGSDLTTEQLNQLLASLRPKLAYLRRVRERMEANQFPPHDRLYRGVSLSESMVKDLVLEIETLLSYRGFRQSPEPFQ